MAREKKDGRYVNFYLDQKIYDRLEKYCNEVGQTKTIAVERSIDQFLNNYYKTENKSSTQ